METRDFGEKNTKVIMFQESRVSLDRMGVHNIHHGQILGGQGISENLLNFFYPRVILCLKVSKHPGNVLFSKYKHRALICCVARLETPSDDEVMIQNVWRSCLKNQC